MSTKKPSTPSAGTTVDASTVLNQVEGMFTDADTARATGSMNLATIRSARVNVLQRVRDRLGGNGPEAAVLDVRLAADKEFAAALSAQGALATKPRVT